MTNSSDAEGSLGFGFRELAIWISAHPGAALLTHWDVWVHDCPFRLFWTDVCGDIVNDEEREILCEMFVSVLGSGMSPSPVLLWTGRLLTTTWRLQYSLDVES